MYLSRRGFFIPKSLNSKKLDIESIKKKLVATPYINPEFDLSDGPVPFNNFEETDTHLIIPKYYGMSNFKKYDNQLEIKNKRNITFNGSLREYQQNIINIVIPKLNESYGGLISIPTGRGKTIIAVKLACDLGLKTLFIVHKTFFLEQTKEKFQQFSNAKIGVLQQKTIDVEDKDIVIGMLQSILSRDYGDEIMNQFDLIIFDECHHLSSKEFSKVFTKIRPVYSIGLSATPKRKDKLENVFEWFVGPTLYMEKAPLRHVVDVRTINFSSKHKKFKNVFNRNKQALIPTMVSNLTEIDERNELIVNEIIKLKMEEPERNFLILSGRREHLNILADLVKKKEPSLDEEITFYIGVKKKELKKMIDDALEKSLIFGTYEMASEGLDIQHLDTLILTTPKGDVNQVVGRILRKQPTDYELQPKILDFCDELQSLKFLADIRMRLYKSRRYIINGVEPPPEEISEENLNLIKDDNINRAVESRNIIKTEKVDFTKSLF